MFRRNTRDSHSISLYLLFYFSSSSLFPFSSISSLLPLRRCEREIILAASTLDEGIILLFAFLAPFPYCGQWISIWSVYGEKSVLTQALLFRILILRWSDSWQQLDIIDNFTTIQIIYITFMMNNRFNWQICWKECYNVIPGAIKKCDKSS